MAFRLDPKKKHHYDEFAIAHQLKERGWVVPAYTMAPHSEKLKLMRVVVREDFSRPRCDGLVKDVKHALESLNDMETREKVMEHVQRWKKQSGRSRAGKGKVGGEENVYSDEDHSLQGKTGKTHAVC